MIKTLRIIHTTNYTNILQEAENNNNFVLAINVNEYIPPEDADKIINKIIEQYSITHLRVRGKNRIESIIE